MIMNNIKIAKKKPIEIEAIQITGTDENIKEIQNFCGRWSFKRGGHIEFILDDNNDNNFSVDTLEGIASCHTGDWIAKGVENEIYPIKKSVFESSHDIIGEYKYQGIATPR
jgi:hypothetical protein